MLNNNEQSMISGSNANNYQAGRDVYVNGISYSDARNIALDVFESNFLKLSEDASRIVFARIEAFLNEFLRKMQEQNISANIFSKPNFQYTLYNAELGYAKDGSDELKSNLLELLIERTKENERTQRQLLLDDAISIMPKLSELHIDCLSLFYLVPESHQSKELDSLVSNFKKMFLCHHDEVFDWEFFSFLEYCNLTKPVISSFAPPTIQKTYTFNYRKVFSKGFSNSTIENILPNKQLRSKICMLHPDSSSRQFVANNEDELRQLFKKNEIVNEKEALLKLYKDTAMSWDEIKEFFADVIPGIESMFESWDKRPNIISMNTCTPLGYLIGEINIKKKISTNI